MAAPYLKAVAVVTVGLNPIKMPSSTILASFHCETSENMFLMNCCKNNNIVLMY